MYLRLGEMKGELKEGKGKYNVQAPVLSSQLPEKFQMGRLSPHSTLYLPPNVQQRHFAFATRLQTVPHRTSKMPAP